MEKLINELEFDEFEELLGEIPNATSGTAANSVLSRLTNLSNNVKRVSFNPSEVSLRDEFQNGGILDEENLSVQKIRQSHIKIVQQEEEPNLPDEHSLTSAFADLSFNNGEAAEAEIPQLASFKHFQNHPIMINGQMPPNVDCRAMLVPDYSSHTGTAGSFEISGAKRSFQELTKQSAGYCHHIDNFPDSFPFTHGMRGYHVHGLEVPIFSDQQHYFMDTQSQLPYLHSQLNQPHGTWGSVEEEQYYRMHKQYLYMQKLGSQQLESHNSIQSNGNVAARIITQNLWQPHNELSDLEVMRSKGAFSRSINLSNPVISSTDFNKMQGLEKLGKPGFPNKILTRSHGLNSLRSVKFGSFVGNELLDEVNQNGRVLSNGHYHKSLSNSDAAFLLHNASPRGLFADSADLKHNNNSRPLQQYNSVDDIIGRIYFLAKDQHGCRFLQKKFTEGTQEDVKKIFIEIIVNIVELMTDPFGNYLVQKLLEVCDEDQRMQILCAITRRCGDLVRISCDMHGTRAVQKVIETLKTREQCSMVVYSLKPGIVTVIKNMNGNHVAQRCLQYLMPEYCEFLFEAAINNCIELATDRHGCCVLQKCISHCDGDRRHRLISEITSNALILSQDPFGNYVVQFIFEIHAPWATADILDQLEGNYGDLSMQKYSSNVVEKCLKYAGEECRSCIIKELVNNPRLDHIMQDPYGNYVIQAALNNSKVNPPLKVPSLSSVLFVTSFDEVFQMISHMYRCPVMLVLPQSVIMVNSTKQIIAKYFYSEKVFDDSSTDQRKIWWHHRNFFSDVVPFSGRTQSSDACDYGVMSYETDLAYSMRYLTHICS